MSLYKYLKIDNNNFLKAIIVFIGFYFIASYFFIVFNRINYPFELEWMEGGTLLHIIRLSEGMPLYVAPSVDFIPAIYTPLYYYISEMACSVWGINFFSIRLVSFISSLLILVNIYLISFTLTKSKFYSFLALSLFIASFKASGAWLDIGRVDSLTLFFMLTGLFLLLQENNLLYLILSAIFFVLSYFTKQNSLIFFVFVFCFIFLENRRFALIFLIIFGICIVVITQFFQSINDGWYNYYTLILSNSLDKKLNKIFTFWINDLIKNFPIGVLSIIILIFINKIFSNVLRKRYYLILLGLIIISYLPRLLIGGYENALIPAFIGISVFSAMSFKYINNLLPKDFHKFLYLSIIIQLLVLYYPVKPQIPSVNDKTKGELLIDKITKFNGEVFFSDHPYYLILAGKKPQAHTMAISDFINSNTNIEYRNKLLNDFSGRIKSKKYEALIFDRDDFLLKIFYKEINESYSLIDNNLTGNYFIPVTGGTNKPTFLYVRK